MLMQTHSMTTQKTDYEEFQQALLDPNSDIEIDDCAPSRPQPTGKWARVAKLFSPTGYAYISSKDKARQQERGRARKRPR